MTQKKQFKRMSELNSGYNSSPPLAYSCQLWLLLNPLPLLKRVCVWALLQISLCYQVYSGRNIRKMLFWTTWMDGVMLKNCNRYNHTHRRVVLKLNKGLCVSYGVMHTNQLQNLLNSVLHLINNFAEQWKWNLWHVYFPTAPLYILLWL